MAKKVKSPRKKKCNSSCHPESKSHNLFLFKARIIQIVKKLEKKKLSLSLS